MKNVNKFIYAKFHTLTKNEWDELVELVYKICDNHEDDKWWKVDKNIRTCIDYALMARESDEEYATFCEEENKDED